MHANIDRWLVEAFEVAKAFLPKIGLYPIGQLGFSKKGVGGNAHGHVAGHEQLHFRKSAADVEAFAAARQPLEVDGLFAKKRGEALGRLVVAHPVVGAAKDYILGVLHGTSRAWEASARNEHGTEYEQAEAEEDFKNTDVEV